MPSTLHTFSPEEAVAMAKGLFNTIRSYTSMTEQLRRQPEELMVEIISSGLIRLLVPRRWGGHELGWNEVMNTAIEIAKANP
ncbi:MAG: hypothetical protein K6T81_17345, partial [Alicyclobacillus macrosporangiidus]|nr:hypothetical protein [Alicyclobacillus macrosporangiidus]